MARYVYSLLLFSSSFVPLKYDLVDADVLTRDPQPYVTELDLRHSLVPDEIIEDLVKTMPAHKGPDLQVDRNVPKFDYISYMEHFMGDNHGNGPSPRNGKVNGVEGHPGKSV